MLAYHVPPAAPAHVSRIRHRASGAISHVVVVIQENRTIDNLFNGFCAGTNQCANTVTTDTYTNLPLKPLDLDALYGPGHSHEAFETDFANGTLKGFKGKQLSYVPSSELTSGYWKIFTVDGVLNDNIFAPNQGPSFPAHEYGIAGQAGGYDAGNEDIADNPGNSAPTYCGSGTMTESVSLQTTYPGQTMSTPLCRDHQTIFDTAVAQGYTWRYYAAWGKKHKNLWAPTQAIQHLYNSPYFVPNPSAILTDIANGTLANVAFVTPISSNSDHPKDMTNNTASQQWVASIVNAIGESPYWNNTVIIVYWDDFGGWFDHVPPVFAPDPFLASGQNPNEYGFRLPYGVVSAYANTGTVSHAGPCSASDSLNFIEGTFGLAPLGTEDVYNTGCTASMLNLSAAPHSFVPIVVSGSARRR